MTEYRIPFNRPMICGSEMEFIADSLSASHISGDGKYSRRCHEYLERTLGVARAFLTTSCTHALEMAALLLDIKPGDEVIVPSFTFVSSINAFVLRGATPVFADSRPDTLNLDERKLPALITDRTRAIVLVHYAGVACEMDAIMSLARQHGIAVVEDSAHALFSRYKGRHLSTYGQLATLSFHETKNFTCGEGGALLINDAGLVERAEIIREKGTNRGRFFRGQVDKYTWVDVGSSYLPSDMLAAYLWAQFERAADVQARRGEIWRQVCGWSDRMGLNAWCAIARRSRILRSVLPYVLPAAALVQRADGADSASQGSRDSKRIPLSAAASVGDGPALWRQTRRLPGRRKRVGQASALALLLCFVAI